MTTYPVNTDREEADFLAMFCKRDRAVSWHCSIHEVKDTRSAKQNRLSHVLYGEIERQRKEYTSDEAKNMSKYYCGLGIIMAEEPLLAPKYQKALESHGLEDRIDIMGLLPMTSLFTVKQKALYLDRMYKYWEQAGVYQLPRPDDLYYEALMVKR